MQRHLPPFRADHVGSLLRPPELKQARVLRERGEISAQDLCNVEDRLILDAIQKQEAVGLQSSTDGEFRRAMWHFDFLERLDGVESFASDHGIAFQGGIETKAKGLRVFGKIGYAPHPMVDHFRFLQAIYEGDTQDDHSVARRAPFSRRPESRQLVHLSGYGGVL
jgi:methionine synthase II (cobalamin-independent)